MLATFTDAQQKGYGVDEYGAVAKEKLNDFNTRLSSLYTEVSAMQVLPPWWTLEQVKPSTQELPCVDGIAEGRCGKVSVFSESQQKHFGIDGFGVILDQFTFDYAIRDVDSARGADTVENAAAPWWVERGVVPEGAKKKMNGWNAATFSKDQQEEYGVKENGVVADQEKFNAATMAPPWWIIHGIVPEGDGEEVADGRFLANTFSKDQQDTFGIDQ